MRAKDCELAGGFCEQLCGRFAASLELSVAKIVEVMVRAGLERITLSHSFETGAIHRHLERYLDKEACA
jgi:hypothetical protein